MENIIIIPESTKQSSVIKAFLKEMKVRFETQKDDTKMSKEEFFQKIDEAKQQIKEGKSTVVRTKEELHSFLDSL